MASPTGKHSNYLNAKDLIKNQKMKVEEACAKAEISTPSYYKHRLVEQKSARKAKKISAKSKSKKTLKLKSKSKAYKPTSRKLISASIPVTASPSHHSAPVQSGAGFTLTPVEIGQMVASALKQFNEE